MFATVCRVVGFGDSGDKYLQIYAPVSLILIQDIGISKKSFTVLFAISEQHALGYQPDLVRLGKRGFIKLIGLIVDGQKDKRKRIKVKG